MDMAYSEVSPEDSSTVAKDKLSKNLREFEFWTISLDSGLETIKKIGNDLITYHAVAYPDSFAREAKSQK